jgi:biotin carboxylase
MTTEGDAMPQLMLIGVGRMGRPYLAAARRLGVRTHAVEATARADALAGELDGVKLCRGELDELWVEAASAAVKTHQPDAVIAFSEPHVIAAALLQDSLGLPGPSLHAAVLSRNKALQRGRFAAHGVRQPGYLVTDDVAAEAEWAAARLPVVLKPLSSAGSDGVELVAGIDDYGHVAARRSGERALLIETAVDGPEYSWEALVVDGRVWASNLTAKETTGPPNFIEISHRTGVQLDPASAAAVDHLTGAVLEALRMRTGLVHLEFRMAPAGPTLMEVAVRTPGDFLMELLTITYGVDWFEMVVRAALSWPLPQPPSAPVRYAASYLPVAQPGVVAAVRGLAEVRAHPAVVRAELAVSEGDDVAPARSSAGRVGHVVLAADDGDALEQALAEVRETLAVITRPR